MLTFGELMPCTLMSYLQRSFAFHVYIDGVVRLITYEKKKRRVIEKQRQKDLVLFVCILVRKEIGFGHGYCSPEAVFVVLRLSLAVIVYWETNAIISSSTVGEGRICFKESV